MKLLLATHGELSKGLLDSYSMIAGNTKDIHTVSLTETGMAGFKKSLNELLADLTKNDKVLIMCDLKGGTPYNESFRYWLENEEKVKVITGVNLPMLIETGMSKDHSDLESLSKIAYKAGVEGVYVESSNSTDEEEFDLEF